MGETQELDVGKPCVGEDGFLTRRPGSEGQTIASGELQGVDYVDRCLRPNEHEGPHEYGLPPVCGLQSEAAIRYELRDVNGRTHEHRRRDSAETALKELAAVAGKSQENIDALGEAFKGLLERHERTTGEGHLANFCLELEHLVMGFLRREGRL